MRPWLTAGGLLVLLVALTAPTSEDPPIVSPTVIPALTAPLRVRPVNEPDPLTFELQRLQEEAQRYRSAVFVN